MQGDESFAFEMRMASAAYTANDQLLVFTSGLASNSQGFISLRDADDGSHIMTKRLDAWNTSGLFYLTNINGHNMMSGQTNDNKTPVSSQASYAFVMEFDPITLDAEYYLSYISNERGNAYSSFSNSPRREGDTVYNVAQPLFSANPEWYGISLVKFDVTNFAGTYLLRAFWSGVNRVASYSLPSIQLYMTHIYSFCTVFEADNTRSILIFKVEKATLDYVDGIRIQDTNYDITG